jgi:hypothetical protein
VTGVLSELKYPDNTARYSVDDEVDIISLGSDGYGVKNNNWFFNISPEYEVKTIVQLTSKVNGAARFRITTIDENIFAIGSIGTIKSSTGLTYEFFAISVADLYTFDINLTFDIDLNAKYYISRGINQVNSAKYSDINITSSDVQNVYIDGDDLYVASSSLPTYLNTQLDIKDFEFTFTGSFSGTTLNVGANSFYTGDAVYYESQGTENTLNIPDGLYFIKKEGENDIRLSTSRSNIFNSVFVEVYGDVVQNKLYLYKFYGKSLQSQELIRKISNPIDDGKLYPNNPGTVGIFKNGVEILSYRSNDNIYYGKMKGISVSSGGNGDYDVINPPIIHINDAVGSGATGVCHVKGSLSRIDIIDGGFDFIEDPKVSIFGGNGEGAKAKCNMSAVFQISKFNSGSDYDFVDLDNNTIGFSTYHRFRQLEKAIYLTEDQTPIGNLVPGSIYYLKTVDPLTVQVHNNYDDAFVGINTINLSTNGSGLHKFQSVEKKKIISSIEILSPGKNYTNKKLFFKSSDINEYSNIIKIEGHGYLDKEIVYYNSSNSLISGLTSTTPYYVKVIDEDNIRLSFVGLGTSISKDYYYNTQNYIDFGSVGSGIHELNYEPIIVKIEGPIGIATVSGQDFNPKIQPIFRGFIESVSLSDNGENYGDPNILNYNRQPLITLKNGVGAVLIPIISSTGSIIDILITNRGSYYNSPPKLEISGDGSGAILTPIIQDGFLSSVKIISGGSGYSNNNTRIQVISAGNESKFEAIITSWTVNLVERLINSNEISIDDGVVRNSINANYGLQYCHAYAPSKLREKCLSSALGQDGELIYRSEILNDDLTPKYHSSILGWAYDGNPIYGPYGYSNRDGGEVKRLVSGYKYIPNPLRPSNYSPGFFVEDYTFVGDGDLDIHNGRYCVTPDFPNGTYAYFVTVSKSKEISGPFRNKLRPVFPYIIGNYFKSKLNDFNYNYNSNQNDIDLNSTGWFRNTNPYGLLKEYTNYNGVVQPDKFKQKYSLISSVSRGFLDELNIISPGNNYKVGDDIFFNNTNSGGSGAYANITKIYGQNSTKIEYIYDKISEVQLINYRGVNNFVGITTSPHNFNNNDVVSIQNLNIFGTQLNNNFAVGISTNILKISKYIPDSSITGIVTYINVSGNLTYPLIMVNDILGIGTEQVRVLEIDNNQFRLKVRRAENSTIGISHSEGIDAIELPRKFYFNVGYTTSVKYELNREFYFNPADTLGIGSVGIGTTIIFSNPGTGASQIFVPYKSILFPNHNLNTGDKLIYRNNGNGSIRVSTATSIYDLPDSTELYTAKISNDLVGITTVNIGIGTDGNIVGIETSAELLTFVNPGSGVDHSFIINSDFNLTGDVYKKSARVTTSPNDHQLSVGDKISVNVFSGIQTTFVVQYNEVNRRLVINPTNFTALDIDIDTDTISISNHGYTSGQKIIHTSGSPSGGLDDQGVYYVIVIDENRIKLSKDYYNTINLIFKLNIVDITSASFGALSMVNPQLNAVKYSIINFDLSDPSLSSNGIPAFNFNLYTDFNFKNKYFGNLLSDGAFNVTKIGDIGVDDNAKLILKMDENTPQLYYNLEPINSPENAVSKVEIIEDDFNILNNNKLAIIDSGYAIKSSVTGVTTNTFTYPLYSTPEKSFYIDNESIITYTTSSKSAIGPVSDISIESTGRSYKKLPSILKTSSGIGTNALFLPDSKSIGKIQEVVINEIGFDYPVDLTLSPSASLPQTYKIEPLSKFKSIKIISPGINYYIAPKLVVIDGFTGRVNDEVDLRYNLGDTEITIVRNSTGFYNVLPIILPTSNPNGSRISGISYDLETGDVVVGLAVTYASEDLFPFSIGEKIIIENTNVTPDIEAEEPYGYNSSNYGYNLFIVKDINPNIGELTPTITFSLVGYLPSGRTPGNFDSFESFGSVTPEKYFPTFAVTLEKGTFYGGEEVSIAGYKKGIVQVYDIRNEYLKVRTKDRIEINDLVVGKTSGNKGIISIILKYDSSYKIDSNSITKKGWQKNTGYIGDNLQRIHDNDYYQYFSYAIRSPIEYDTWNPIVRGLTHTSGFKKFGELLVDSYDKTVAGISTDQNLGLNFSVSDIIGNVDLNSVKDFDIAKEKSIFIDNGYVSNEILFKLPFLQKFQEFIGNRVLKVDDISEQFDNNNLSFGLYSNNYPIFKINFEGDNPLIVNEADNLIDLNNHYFVSGEEIQYIPPDNNFANAIGIGTTTITGIGLTDKLPGSVYVIKIDTQKIQLSSSPENALLFKPIPLDITSVGIGSTHIFKSINQNTRLLVTINNMIQSPVVSTAITSQLDSSVGIGSTVLISSGISSIFGGDLIQINDEIMKIVSVGVGSTNSIDVLRSWMGTTESSHSSNTLITKLTGNYNIVDNTLNFIEPIWGNIPVGYGTTAPTSDQIDYSGLTTSSRFSGRVFLRSSLNQAFTTSYVKAYDTNYVFDDISQGFNGITTQFTLKQNKLDIGGISEGNAIILINDIFQGPQRLGNSLTDIIGDYKLTGTSGITTLNFTGTTPDFDITNDINSSNVPRGGILVTVGSTGGLGYQPLVAAGGTAIVSVAGTISQISIGNSGSGYRSGLQTVRVGIQTASYGVANITYIGIASVSNGHVVGIAITNPKVFYAPKEVVNIGYSSVTGVTTVTTSIPHGLRLGEEVSVVGAAFTCDYYPPLGVGSAKYDNVTGIMTVTTVGVATLNVINFTYDNITGVSTIVTSQPHKLVTQTAIGRSFSLAGLALTCVGYGQTFGVYNFAYDNTTGISTIVTIGSHGLTAGDNFKMRDIIFDCPIGGATGYGQTFTITQFKYDNTTGLATVTTSSSFSGVIGIGSDVKLKNLEFSCPGGSGITTSIFPDGTQGFTFRVSNVLSSTKFETNVGVSTILHTYVENDAGQVTAGLTTSLFPDGTQGYFFTVNTVGTTTSFTVNVGPSSIAHTYVSGGVIQVGINTDIFPGNSLIVSPLGNTFEIKSVVNGNTLTFNSGVSTIPHTYVSGGTLTFGHKLKVGTDVILTGLGFTCSLGVGIHTYPRTTDPTYCGTQVTKINSLNTFEINVGVTTVPTFYFSGGTVEEIIIAPRQINNSPTGQDPAANGTGIVKIVDDYTFIINSGPSPYTHFYKRCGKVTKPVDVIFDSPLNYYNIPLIYKSGSIGIGTGATVDIVVGQGSSVINFELKNTGYAYNTGDILTIPFGGIAGIPTDISSSYREFNIFVDNTYNAKFAGWSVGDFLGLDDISKYFNGKRKLFPLSRNAERLSFYARQSSGIDLQSNLLVFINDILQVPGESYTFSGGSILRFLDAPKGGIVGLTTLGDTCKLFMYTGTQTIDVKEVQVLETIKIGDNVQLYSDYDETLTEEERLVVDINAADSILTNNYAGQGVVGDELLERPISWYKQLEDKIIDGLYVGKDRVYYEPNINPSAYLIQSVGIGSTELFVNSIRPFFDDPIESIQDSDKNVIEILSQKSLVAAAATCNVSAGGSVTEITITNPGYGYTTNPMVTIQSPSLGSNNYAVGISTINSSGIVTSIQVSVGGTGYFYGPAKSLSITSQGSGFPNITPSTNTFVKARLKTRSGYGLNATANIEINPNNFRVVSASIVDGGYNYKIGDQLFLDTFDNVGLALSVRRSALTNPIVFTVATIQPPIVLISPPTKKVESISNITYNGDYGIIVGVGTTDVGITTGITFDFYIPENSFMSSRYSIYKSGIQTGYYFTITNSSLGYGITSLNGDNSILGIGSTCLDNIYEVISTNQVLKSIPNVGITTVIKVTTKVSNYNGLVGIATTAYYGEYSWGKVDVPIRTLPVEYTITTNIFSGIGTNPIVRRRNPLKYFGYFV